MDESIISQLQTLNFSSNEAKVYTALLEIGQTSAGEIIKKTQLHRSVVYETLDKLIARKLVFKLEKQKIAFYQATDPEKIVHHIKSQETLALELVPQLKQLIYQKLPEITIYEGREEWTRYWFDRTIDMPRGSIDYVAGSLTGRWTEIMGQKFTDKYTKLRLERKIKLKMIVFRQEAYELSLLRAYPQLHEYRLIEKKIEPEANFNIWQDSLILVSGAEPMIIEVKNQTLVKGFKNIFDILWESGKPL